MSQLITFLTIILYNIFVTDADLIRKKVCDLEIQILEYVFWPICICLYYLPSYIIAIHKYCVIPAYLCTFCLDGRYRRFSTHESVAQYSYGWRVWRRECRIHIGNALQRCADQLGWEEMSEGKAMVFGSQRKPHYVTYYKYSYYTLTCGTTLSGCCSSLTLATSSWVNLNLCLVKIS